MRLNFMHFALALLVLFGNEQRLCAQLPYAYHLTDDDGLPSNEIYDLHQTRDGYIWLATDAGLARYNGRKFLLFANGDAKGKSVSYLHEDSRGRLWCANFSGQLFYIAGDSLHRYKWVEPFSKGAAFDFNIDANDNLYILIKSQKCQLGVINLKMDTKFKEIPLSDDALTAWIGITHRNEIALSNETGIEIRQNGQWQGLNRNAIFAKRFEPIAKQLLNYNYHLRASKTGKGSFLIPEMASDLYWYDGKNYSKHPIAALLEKHKAIPHWIEDSDSTNIFVATFSGVLWCEKRGETYIEKGFLWEKDGFSTIIRDREGNYWFGTVTSRNGIFVISNTNIQFYGTPRGIFARHLAALGNTIYIADAQAGIFSRKPDDNTWKTVTTTLFDAPRDPNSLAANPATNQIWLSQTTTKAVDATGKKQAEISTGFARNLAFLGKSAIVFTDAQSAFIVSLSPEGNKLIAQCSPFGKKIVWIAQPHVQLREVGSRAVFYDEHQQYLYIGYINDLLCYDFRKNTIDTLRTIDKKPIIARSIITNERGTIFVGTVKDGLYIFNKNKQEIAHFSTDGIAELAPSTPTNTASIARQMPEISTEKKPLKLVSNSISKLILIKNRLWLATDNGVQFIDFGNWDLQTNLNTISRRQKQSIKTGVIDRNDGLVSNEINNMIYISETNTIWLATPKGIQSFKDNIFTENNTPPKVYINRIAINEKDTVFSGNITIPHHKNDVTFGLDGLAFRSRGNFSYHYRLRGLSDKWSVADSRVTFARYPSLPTGDYDFEVYVTNEDGLQSREIATVHIRVLSPPWLTWWALMAYVLGIIGVIYAIYRWRFGILKTETDLILRNAQIEQDLRTSQLSTLQVQMNPHFIFNALNSIQEYILLNEKRLANEFLGKFADLMRYTLDMSQQKEVPLSDEINALQLYLDLENLRFDNTLRHTIEIGDTIEIDDLKIPSMLLQPYVENAIKHGLLHRQGEKLLHILFTQKEDDRLVCIITDNGIGRDKAMAMKQQRNTSSEHRSFATTATQKRLELLNHGRNAAIMVKYKDLFNAQNQASGTQVLVSIPV